MLLIFNDMGIVKWYQLKQERHHIQAKIDQLLIEEKDLSAELVRLENNDEYIKKIAREKFHFGQILLFCTKRRKICRKFKNKNR